MFPTPNKSTVRGNEAAHRDTLCRGPRPREGLSRFRVPKLALLKGSLADCLAGC